MKNCKRNSRILAVMIAMVFMLMPVNVNAASNKITLKSVNSPSTVYVGNGYSIKGKVKAKKKIVKVQVGVVNSAGSWVYKYTKKPNAKSFNIKKADSKIRFGKLDEGTYYYRINVKLKGVKNKTVLNNAFDVVDNRADSSIQTYSTDGITVRNCALPGTYQVGKTLAAKGTIECESRITKVEIGIVNDATNKWTDYKYETILSLSSTFDISRAASTLRFDKLAGGKYHYRIYAHTADGVKLGLNYPFEVLPSTKPQQAVNWAVMIANNDEFSYGKKPKTSKVGCYFCGTNQKNKPAGYEKTYVCSTFVHAAFAHGAGDPEMLKHCQSGKYCMSETESNFKNYSCWFKVGLCKDLTVSDLQPGDVIIYYASDNYSGHVMIYVGGDQFVDSEGIKDCWGPNSIAVRNGAAAKLKSGANFNKKSYVMRYCK